MLSQPTLEQLLSNTPVSMLWLVLPMPSFWRIERRRRIPELSKPSPLSALSLFWTETPLTVVDDQFRKYRPSFLRWLLSREVTLILLTRRPTPFVPYMLAGERRRGSV